MGSDTSFEKVVVNISSSHNHVFFWYFFTTAKSKKKFSAHEVQITYYSLKGKLCWYGSTYTCILTLLMSLCHLSSSQLCHITKLNYFKLVLTKGFNLNSNILQNPNILFQTTYSTFLPVLIHTLYELCSYAYLYRQKGFEQGSIQGDLGIWGKFQLHMELVRRQLGGVKGKARWSCGRRNHTLGCFLWRPQHR